MEGLVKLSRFSRVALLVLLSFSFTQELVSQAIIEGRVFGAGEELPGAQLSLSELGMHTFADNQGEYQFSNIPAGTWSLKVYYLGYLSQTDTLIVKGRDILQHDIHLKQDQLDLEQVVVSATRQEVAITDAPVMVSRIGKRTFETTQSLSLSEGLSFSPGLRLENNCQNCGFTQLRMNGLGGGYSQVLINSRPVFSALVGVYGLDMIPTNMIDRVEVVRGGGSALYGGNAIAGTVNIITRDPVQNHLEMGVVYSSIDGTAPDRVATLNGALVSKDLNKGVNVYAFHRDRDQWDANGDGFSELTLLENTTVGLDAFWNTSPYGKIELNAYTIQEFRRGGNDFELPPHQTDITEQLTHGILGGSLSFEQFLKDRRHKFSLYTSLQSTNRDSYYGGGGRILQPGDSLTASDVLAINAYGRSRDISWVNGLQYSFTISSKMSLVAGSEWQWNEVEDNMPGYGRRIDQEVRVWGNYVQLQLEPLEKLSLLIGGRYDHVDISGEYDYSEDFLRNDRQLGVFVPRITAMYQLDDFWRLRAAFAQGYRAPQAFDEDLHIETVGGAATFIELAPDLSTERSNSFTGSVNYTRVSGKNQMNLVAEVFLTQLIDPFITANQRALPSGVAVLTKRNGGGAVVQGLNLEANVALGSDWLFQTGFTLQSARFDEEETLWTPEELNEGNRDSVVSTRNLLRTPNAYGYYSLSWQATSALLFSVSGLFTGAMEVPHVINPSNEYTIIERTPSFFEQNLKVQYSFLLEGGSQLKLTGGMQNAFNSYQEDFDRGPERDAGYVYGPGRPRTFFLGITFGL